MRETKKLRKAPLSRWMMQGKRIGLWGDSCMGEETERARERLRDKECDTLDFARESCGLYYDNGCWRFTSSEKVSVKKDHAPGLGNTIAEIPAGARDTIGPPVYAGKK